MDDEELEYRFYERAGFLEYECGMTREQAERIAREEVYGD